MYIYIYVYIRIYMFFGVNLIYIGLGNEELFFSARAKNLGLTIFTASQCQGGLVYSS